GWRGRSSPSCVDTGVSSPNRGRVAYERRTLLRSPAHPPIPGVRISPGFAAELMARVLRRHPVRGPGDPDWRIPRRGCVLREKRVDEMPRTILLVPVLLFGTLAASASAEPAPEADVAGLYVCDGVSPDGQPY